MVVPLHGLLWFCPNIDVRTLRSSAYWFFFTFCLHGIGKKIRQGFSLYLLLLLIEWRYVEFDRLTKYSVIKRCLG